MKSSTYILMRSSLAIISASLALLLVNDIAGTHWFGGYDKQLMTLGILVAALAAYLMGPAVMEEGLRRRQSRIANPDAYPRRRFSNTQRITILIIAALPPLTIAANCFVGSNWFGHYGLVAVVASIGGFAIVNSLVRGPKRQAQDGQRQTVTGKSGDGPD
jgi:hypothetical protein